MTAPGPANPRDLQQVLGYLNYASGATDVGFLAALNRLAGKLLFESGGTSNSASAGRSTAASDSKSPLWERLREELRKGALELLGTSPTFANLDQALAVIDLAFGKLPPAYREFHRDLLFHLGDDELFNSLLLGRICEAVLRQGAPWNENERILTGAIKSLNDYVGHRPVAVLENRKIEPYIHEWVRPMPLFISGAGVAAGPYAEVVGIALAILQRTDEALLHEACFDPKVLDELAIDPRAYDFDHPANKRPNYHFGQWDPNCLDNQGRYRRFVVQQVALDALMARFHEGTEISHDELAWEAAAVLAGIVLMAAGVSGRGPETHDSSVTLSTLLPKIARYRDAFYEKLLAGLTGKHADRLRAEAKLKRQPFGGARQDLNAQLARRRAAQLEHVQLARLFARMGYPEASLRQADVVPTASARMLCRIDCLLAAGDRALDQRDRIAAAATLPQITDLLKRAIECGAMVDPWNILGFDAQYSLFPALENSVHDHRVDDLLTIIERTFALYSRVWSEAAASNDEALGHHLDQAFLELAQWWHQFAAHEVNTVEAAPALDVYRAAQHVAESLRLWHQGGAAAGNVKFWAPHAERFDSPKAYALVIEALLDRGDFVASLALLISWLSHSARIPLEQGESSFFKLVESWLRLWRINCQTPTGEAQPASAHARHEPWSLVRRLFDLLEANAEEYWEPPRFELLSSRPHRPAAQAEEAEDDAALDREEDDSDSDELYGAAYEDVVYRDSTSDGVESDMLEGGGSTDDELEQEARRLAQRLDFLACLARLGKLAACWPHAAQETPTGEKKRPAKQKTARPTPAARDDLLRWHARALANQQGLLALLDEVDALRLAISSAEQEELMEYDRRRLIKEQLLERIVVTAVELAGAARLMSAAALTARSDPSQLTPSAEPARPKGETAAPASSAPSAPPADALASSADASGEHPAIVRVFASLLSGDATGVRRRWAQVLEALRTESLLYVPLAKGGEPRKIVAVRARQQTIQDLLRWLPRCGLLKETCALIEAARDMERLEPVGPGAVTEFDDLFEIGYKALVSTLVDAAQHWAETGRGKNRAERAESDLVSCLESLTESLLSSWLSHSRTLRLSVLERVRDDKPWKELVHFIERYGSDLFTQKFFSMSNVRAILHQGVENWLTRLADEDVHEEPPALLREMGEKVSREKAIDLLSLVLESILENYGEYRDYNSTTTQSDKGELLYMLLDFLRLRVAYDRVAWNLKPVILAHEILVRRGQHEAAQLWRRALAERIREEADRYLVRLSRLQAEYAMRMPTVADRLNERFVRPMLIDRIRAMVEPAIRQANQPGERLAFEALEFEAAALTEEPTGVGLDIPAWLLALEEEVEQARRPPRERDDHDLDSVLPSFRLSRADIQDQLDQWMQRDQS